MSLPPWARKECERCHGPIAYVRTNRKSKGQPVDIPIDYWPDESSGGTVPVQLSGETLYGNPVSKSQAAAMRAAGRYLYAEHSATCQKRGTSHRNTS